MLKQVINDNDLVNVATLKNLNLEFWKHQNSKAFNYIVKDDLEFKKKLFKEIPSFDKFLILQEMKLGKHRSEFNIFETDAIRKEYTEKYSIDGRM